MFLAVAVAVAGVGCGSSSMVKITIVIQGSGSVSSSPGGVCAGPATCPAIEISPSQSVVMSAVAANGWIVDSWELTVDDIHLTLPVTANGTETLSGAAGSEATVTVTFVPIGSGPHDAGAGG
jgi:hypothetical protein